MCSPRRRRWRPAFPSIRRRWPRPPGSPTACASIWAAISATAIRAPRTTRRCASWPSSATRASRIAIGQRPPACAIRRAGPAATRSCGSSRSSACPGFFLLHHDMLELAREVAVEVRGPDSARALLPPGRGRGSSVSSIVCYLTGLSHVDPIANELLIGRFLNEELTSLPDIDLDFPRDIREIADPARPRALWTRPLGAGGGVSHLPRARGDPRARQGAGTAAGRDRAGGARQRGLGRARGGKGHRERVRGGAGSVGDRSGEGGHCRRAQLERSPGVLGSLGVAGPPRGARPTGFRAISPSTPAG